MRPTRFLHLPRTNVLGVGVHATSLNEAVVLSDHLLRSGARGYACLTGVHGIMEARRDPELQRILNEATLCLPDGMPTVWIGRGQGHRSMGRVYGPDYMLAMCRLSLTRRYRHFLYGGKPGVAELLQRKLEERLPGLLIAGSYTPPFGKLSESQEQELSHIVVRCKPDILWVGLSTPKQERFMSEHLNRLDVPLMAGVGAAFDIHSGLVNDSPEWVKRSGLQWLDRLRKEPRRLGPRYMASNPAFIWNITLQLSGVQQFSLEEASLSPITNLKSS